MANINNSGVINYGNFADNGATIRISNGKSDELGQLIQQLRQAMADTDKVSEAEKEDTYELLEDVGREGKKSFINLLLERLEKWKSLFGATSAIGQSISAIIDVIK